MQISSRKDAIAAGVGQYFTGKPCKSGHIANRYTQSGACAACVAISASASRGKTHPGVVVPRAVTLAEHHEKLRAVLDARDAKEAALRALDVIKIAIHPDDLATVFETAVELCIASHPCLERSDVMPSSTPIKGLPLYRVHVPPEHVDLMRQISNTLYTARNPIDFAQFHRKVIAMMDKGEDDA